MDERSSKIKAEINLAYQESGYLSEVRQKRKRTLDERLIGQKSKAVEIGGTISPYRSCNPRSTGRAERRFVWYLLFAGWTEH